MTSSTTFKASAVTLQLDPLISLLLNDGIERILQKIQRISSDLYVPAKNLEIGINMRSCKTNGIHSKTFL